jgi:hypothetical protein
VGWQGRTASPAPRFSLDSDSQFYHLSMRLRVFVCGKGLAFASFLPPLLARFVAMFPPFRIDREHTDAN